MESREEEKESRRKVLWKIFVSTLYLSAFTFGGGYVIVTLMKKKFVDEYHWIGEDEMLDLVAIAQSSPGAIAVNGAIVVGYKLLGIAPDETCTFGDNLNDIEMLQSAGMSYAVSNAREEVIAAARDTCAPYWENGVLQVLKTFL